MKYSILADVYEHLESTAKKLEKRDILAELYKDTSDEDLPTVVMLSMASMSKDDLGVAAKMMYRVIMRAYGITEKELVNKLKETGDLGLVAEFFAKNRKQSSFAKKELTVSHVYDNIHKLPAITGQGSQDNKTALLCELLSHAKPKEARYIVRTVLGDMRIGVAQGIVRDAIAKAFEKEPIDIENAWNVTGDFGAVAKMAKSGKLKSDIILLSPVRVMLADRAPDMKTALEDFDNSVIEIKLDGFRACVHKKGSEIKIFSRRLDDVTKQFPELVSWCKKQIKADSCIIEGEVLATNEKGNPMPFQRLSRRIQRKYDIEKMTNEIPIKINLFDLIYFNGESWMNHALRERWNKLKNIITPLKNKFELVERIETKNLAEAEKFYKHALAIGQEGVIIKNLDAHYQPGKRVGYWRKVKPIMEPLDLVITGAEWGEGKRAKWLGTLLLAARREKKTDAKHQESVFLATGMMGSGLTEEQMEDLTKTLKPLILEEHGKEVTIKPEIVIEVAYEEIQRSPKYPTGYALRFPRLLRLRSSEKRPEDANTVQDIEKLFKQQKRFKS